VFLKIERITLLNENQINFQIVWLRFIL